MWRTQEESDFAQLFLRHKNQFRDHWLPSMKDLVSLVPSEVIQIQICPEESVKGVRLCRRIATKTFDSIHRSMVFDAEYHGLAVMAKLWETSDTDNGLEMTRMYVFAHSLISWSS